MSATLEEIEAAGLHKRERQIVSPQAGRIDVDLDGQKHERVVNLCANNYLGLASDPRLIQVATNALKTQGYGMANVRFICGTRDQHRVHKNDLRRFWEKKTRSCLQRVLTPMVGYLNRC